MLVTACSLFAWLHQDVDSTSTVNTQLHSLKIWVMFADSFNSEIIAFTLMVNSLIQNFKDGLKQYINGPCSSELLLKLFWTVDTRKAGTLAVTQRQLRRSLPAHIMCSGCWLNWTVPCRENHTLREIYGGIFKYNWWKRLPEFLQNRFTMFMNTFMKLLLSEILSVFKF